ncbi:MAG: hypothetical protein R2875_09200 [Desulfobacterales bacterium]
MPNRPINGAVFPVVARNGTIWNHADAFRIAGPVQHPLTFSKP